MGLYDGISAVNEVLTGATAIAASKKESIIKQTMNGVLLFIIFAIFGCLDFATLTFNVNALSDPSFWGTVGTKTIAGVAAFNIGINLMIDQEMARNSILRELIVKYNVLNAKRQVDFEFFVTKVFNRQEKKKAYISQINRKINIVNRLSRRKDRLLYSSDLPGAEEQRKKNRYCIIRKELENLKSEEFIEKNIDSLSVRYYEVDPSVFELEIDGSPSIRGVKTKGSLALGRAKATSSVIMGMVCVSAFFAAFGLEADKNKFDDQMVAFWHYFLKAAEDLFVILWQTFQGMLRTRRIVSQQYTEPYAGRVKVLTAYLEWRLSQNIPDSKSHTEIEKMIEKAKESEEEIIEVTPEELAKMREIR